MKDWRYLGRVGLGLLLGSVVAGAADAQQTSIWNAVVRPNVSVAFGGVSQEFTVHAGANGVTSVDPPSTNLAASFNATFNASTDMASMSLANSRRTVDFNTANDDTIVRLSLGGLFEAGRLFYGLSSDWTRKAVFAHPNVNGWSYQFFGVWTEGLGMSRGSMGAASVGAITAGAVVPQTGSATFSGLMGGIYNDASGQDHIVTANMGLAVNFGAHDADFWTTDTYDTTGHDYSDLDLRGVFYSLANHPALFGSLTSARLEGDSSAQFYGPAAEEVGGVFTLTPKSKAGLERLAGAFGGKRGAASNPETPPPNSPFRSWAEDARPGATVTLAGDVIIQPWLAFSKTVVGATLTARINADGKLAAMSAETPTKVVSVDAAAGDLLADSLIEVRGVSKDRRTFAWFGPNAATSPKGASYNYMSYGLWNAWPTGNSDDSFVGVGAFGAASLASAISTGSPNATFAGGGSVHHRTPDGRTERTESIGVTVAVDFASRTARFSSSAASAVWQPSGAMVWSPGENRLTGTLATATLSGPVMARFFGPTASELGGIFSLTPSASGSRESLVGAFGAKR